MAKEALAPLTIVLLCILANVVYCWGAPAKRKNDIQLSDVTSYKPDHETELLGNALELVPKSTVAPKTEALEDFLEDDLELVLKWGPWNKQGGSTNDRWGIFPRNSQQSRGIFGSKPKKDPIHPVAQRVKAERIARDKDTKKIQADIRKASKAAVAAYQKRQQMNQNPYAGNRYNN